MFQHMDPRLLAKAASAEKGNGWWGETMESEREALATSDRMSNLIGGGWYDLKAEGVCDCYCCWRNATSTDSLPHPSTSTIAEEGGFWTCTEDYGESWSDRGGQGDSFKLAMCLERNEVIRTGVQEKLESPVFWSVSLPLFCASFAVGVWMCRRRGAKSKAKEPIMAEQMEYLDGDIELSGQQTDTDKVRMSLVSDEGLSERRRCSRCSSCCLLFSKFLFLFWSILGIAISSVDEIKMTGKSDGELVLMDLR